MKLRIRTGRRIPLPCGMAVIVLLLASHFAAGIQAGCGSQTPHLPNVTTSFEEGPSKRQVTIGLASTGDGYGVADLVLTYPDGRRKAVGNAILEDGTETSWGPRGLRPGTYSYTVYAVATAKPSKDLQFPDSARTDEHILRTGTFVIH